MTGRWAREVLEHSLSRRTFLRTAGAAAAVAAFGTLGCVSASNPSPTASPTIVPSIAPASAGNMVVATNADPVKLVDSALDPFGGLEDVIKSGDKVLLKANFSFARTVDQAASNHPQVLARIMQRCSSTGASEVTAFDHTMDNPTICLDKSGIKAAVDAIGLKVISVNGDKDFEDKTVPGSALKSIKLAKLMGDADVFINVPVIKSHSTTRLTAGMKNLMGVIWDRQAFHSNDLDACIADLAAYARPSLVIADAYRVLKTGGPQGGGSGDQVIQPHQLIVGKDPVAVDSYAATLLGLKGSDVDHIMCAYRLGLGEYDLGKVPIQKVG